ncbi:hypothetical protein L3X38_010509 [Prunus dulcis]|uniref:Uncharacterized protein n=1 Tax=Prunus dulcis TaxID=3755 RepID=A0AAD4WFP0_PRUDU|nr:hypothetical protein L3X38_010509 [Prunus dulcis]
MPPSSPISGFSSVAPSLSAVTSALSVRHHLSHLRSFRSLPAVTVELPSQGFMSDLIRRDRSMTTAPSSDPPAQSASASTAPALMDHVVVGPG